MSEEQPQGVVLTGQEIPEGAPLAINHTREDADEIRELSVEHKQALEDAAKAEPVTARAPGDHADRDDKKTKKDEKGKG